jgi:hypothetical protein
MGKDRANGCGIGEESDDAHLGATNGAHQREHFVDASQQQRPGTVECNATGQKNPSFSLEDPAFMQMFLPTAGTCPASTTQIYRVFSNRPDANHRYMTDKAIRTQMTAKGWAAEGDGPDLVVMCAPQ